MQFVNRVRDFNKFNKNSWEVQMLKIIKLNVLRGVPRYGQRFIEPNGRVMRSLKELSETNIGQKRTCLLYTSRCV